MRKILTVLAALASLSLTNCGYNAIQSQDEQIKANWSEVVNQYQRRADLVPNLVNSVKGFAQQEKDVLLGVTNARAKVGSIQATPEVLNDPAAFQKFTQAQGELSSARQVALPGAPQLEVRVLGAEDIGERAFVLGELRHARSGRFLPEEVAELLGGVRVAEGDVCSDGVGK